jgi:hypothetical protein
MPFDRLPDDGLEFMRKVSIIYFPKNAFASLDAYVPLMVHLADKYGSQVVHDTILIEDGIYGIKQYVADSAFHTALFDRYQRSHTFSLPAAFPGKLNSLYFVFRYLLLALWRRLTSKKVIFINGMVDNTRRGKMLKAISEAIGTTYVVPGTQAVITESFERRLAPEVWNRLVELGVKSEPLIRKVLPKRAICNVSSEIERVQRVNYPGVNVVPVGIPRLMSSWPSVVRSIGDECLRAELLERGLSPDTPSIATIILTNPDFYWFPDKGTSRRLLDEAIKSIREEFPDIPIFLKAKSSMVRLFGDLIENDRNSNIYFTTLGLGALASRSCLAISIQESTGIFDFLTMEIPAIEYSNYSDIHIEIYPERTPWKDVPGYTICESPDELKSAVRAVRQGTCETAQRKQLNTYFGHVEDLEIFGVKPDVAS